MDGVRHRPRLAVLGLLPPNLPFCCIPAEHYPDYIWLLLWAEFKNFTPMCYGWWRQLL